VNINLALFLKKRANLVENSTTLNDVLMLTAFHKVNICLNPATQKVVSFAELTKKRKRECFLGF
jgi:hypothetical protein